MRSTKNIPRKSQLTKAAYLRILAGRLEAEHLPTNEMLKIAHLYADVALFKKEKPKARRVRAKKEPPAPPPKEPTMDEVILQLEKEHRGQLNSVGEGRAGQENEARQPEIEVQRNEG